jgi:hypothetical protein
MYVKFRRELAIAVLALLSGAGAGCQGYRTDPLVPADARRIAVPIFENDTFYRQIEFSLTRDVTDVLRMRPGIYVVPEEEADVVLRGRVTRVSQSVLALGDRERIDERSATTTVHCRLVDRRTGDLVKDFDVSERIDFATATGEDLGAAQHESFYDLARKIVNELEADW